jgi:hypothetical protein
LADAAPAAEAAAAGKAAPAAPVQAEAARAAGVTRPLGQQRDEAAPALKAATPPVASPKAVFDAIRAAPQRWNWRREAEPSRPVDAAMLAWLGDLEAAATRWERGAGAGAPASVTFARGAQPEAWLRFADGTVMLATSTGAAWQATLGADAFAALQSSLERLSR